MAHDKADNSPPRATPDPGQAKESLRSELRQRRRALGSDEQQSAADAAAMLVSRLPGWEAANTIALYIAADGELDPAPIAAKARQENKSLYLPVITADKQLQFHPWEEGAPLAANRYGIPEPTGTVASKAHELDFIFLPLVGWDERGGRLGMGGGFYDRSLADVTGPILVGLAHECQRLAAIPMDDWDVRMDFVATAHALHACRDAP